MSLASSIIPPSSTIGILGGGQLGRMLAIAAAEMGYRAHIYCPEADCPAAEVAAFHTRGEYTDEAALSRFAQAVDVITLEFENIPTKALLHILSPTGGESGWGPTHSTIANTMPPSQPPPYRGSSTPLRPSPQLLLTCQHRIREKEFLKSSGIGTAPFAAVSSRDALLAALAVIGSPAVLKTCEMGYDGKGQAIIRTLEEAGQAWEKLATSAAILEGFVDFDLELSVIVARSPSGEMRCFPPVHNIHKNHILHQTHYPAPISSELARKAESMAQKIAENLQLEGILAVEMFATKDGQLLVNELAPRPHNSGHWTMDACMVSQFEQTIRAVCNLPLAAPAPHHAAIMTNLIGDDVNHWETYLKEPATRLHLYGKKEARPGRKMGHVTRITEITA